MFSYSETAEYARRATELRASSGQALYQSIVAQLMIEGNCLHLSLKDSPTGEKARTMCRRSRHISTNQAYRASLVGCMSVPLALSMSSSMIACFSSAPNRLGISPVLSRLLMSSRKDSLTICVSEKRNCVFSSSRAQFLRSLRMSS